MVDHTSEGQIEKAKRLRERIESLKSGHAPAPEGHDKSLHDRVEERARAIREAEQKTQNR